MDTIRLQKVNDLKPKTIPLPGSKSESNRALLINALCNNPGEIKNLALAQDTEIMRGLLTQVNYDYNARDAGTVMRFMTAYLAVMKSNSQITGTEHMKKRPIGILVEALNSLGGKISYLEKEGYPPLKITKLAHQTTSVLEIASDVSSQYISALLMVAPKLPNGLTVKLMGEPVSTPYIAMTVSIMKHFGVKVDVIGQSFQIAAQSYTYAPFSVESDWSAASYWYAIFTLSNLQELRLAGLRKNSFQGDSIVAELMKEFGVETSFSENSAILTRREATLPKEIDFIKCPDLAQTFAVLCAALGHKCTFLGLQTLKIKETDRILALKTELQKLGGDFVEEDNQWTVLPVAQDKLVSIGEVSINTYNDHRMAMAFAPLATKMTMIIDDASVVNKSYPTFWKDLERIGFILRR